MIECKCRSAFWDIHEVHETFLCNALYWCVCAGWWSAYQIRKTRDNWDKTLRGLKSLSIIKIKLYHCTTRLRVVMINPIVKSTWIIIIQSLDKFESEKKYPSSKHNFQNAYETNVSWCSSSLSSGILKLLAVLIIRLYLIKFIC